MLFWSIQSHFSSAVFLFVFCTVYGRSQSKNLELKPQEDRWWKLCKTFPTFMKCRWLHRSHDRPPPSVCTSILRESEIRFLSPALMLCLDWYSPHVCRLGLVILMTFLSWQSGFSVGVNWCNTIEASGIIRIYPQTPNQSPAPVLVVVSYRRNHKPKQLSLNVKGRTTTTPKAGAGITRSQTRFQLDCSSA